MLNLAEAEKMTRQELRRAVKRLRKTNDPGPLPAPGHRVIYADPPWKYSDKLIEGYGAAEHHYPPMSMDELRDREANHPGTPL